jgi:hypothetical protein
MKPNLMQYLSSVYLVNQPLHVSGISVAQHHEVYCVCVCMYVYVYIYTQDVQLKSGPYFNISNLFTTCYITELT